MTNDRYRTDRATIIEKKGERIMKGSSKSMVKRRGKAKMRENSKKVRIRNAIISFFLV